MIGGISVLTDLNPWVVSFHLLASMAIICVAVLFLRPPRRGRTPWRAPASSSRCWRGSRSSSAGWCSTSAPWSPARDRTPATPTHHATAWTRCSSPSCTPTWSSCSWASASELLFALHATRGSAEAIRAVRVLVLVEVGQGTIGFVQYFTDLPVVLVGFHMLGAAADRRGDDLGAAGRPGAAGAMIGRHDRSDRLRRRLRLLHPVRRAGSTRAVPWQALDLARRGRHPGAGRRTSPAGSSTGASGRSGRPRSPQALQRPGRVDAAAGAPHRPSRRTPPRGCGLPHGRGQPAPSAGRHRD